MRYLNDMTSTKYNRKWTHEEIEKLIKLYEENPCLWNTFDKNYQKRDMREKALIAIAKELDFEITNVKVKWNTIRGQFGRELKRIEASSQSSGPIYVSHWVFWDKLKFLQSVMKTSKRNDSTEDFIYHSKNTPSSNKKTSDTNTVLINLKDETQSKQKKRKLDEAETELQRPYNNAPCNKVAPQEINHFAFHIAAKLNLMSRQQRIMAEKKINDIIFEVEMKEFQ